MLASATFVGLSAFPQCSRLSSEGIKDSSGHSLAVYSSGSTLSDPTKVASDLGWGSEGRDPRKKGSEKAVTRWPAMEPKLSPVQE